jgi:hypothetical protein
MVIAREATLYEISFVAIGADGQTSANVAASNPLAPLTGTNAMNFEQWLQAKGFDPRPSPTPRRPPSARLPRRAARRRPPPPPPPPAPTPPVQAQHTRPPVATQTLDQIFAEQRAETSASTRSPGSPRRRCASGPAWPTRSSG